ncbi:phosphotransferase family protein [Microlunatus parietis]|uniref:Ser/Thr protein kinase RdoA (MazF antagonist) n=1 Tax=Microlunatus parietis TaxID=682979 RepID=A0A7Y9IAN2_9ACTN|nr:phosphotransferase [Microlunatus parietis]NYE73180.1 Ser/Thr protein kinase RdoA (MazF antagonist) [Microlunatus parietis]
MTDDEFLDTLHARFAASPAEVAALVTRTTGAGIDGLERLKVGDENEVHRADLSDGRTVFARIRKPGDGTFDSEVWAMEQARAAGVPVPRVLAVAGIPSDTGERSAMVVEQSPGRPLGDVLPGLAVDRSRTVMINVGRVLARIHSVATPGPRRPDATGRWPDPVEVRHSLIMERESQAPSLEAAGLSAAEIAAALEQVHGSPDVPPRADPVLCHGDLHGAHVFVDDDLAVRGVIDWGLWHGGSRIGDLAMTSTKYGEPEFAAILAGYGIDPDAEFRERLAQAVVSQSIPHLAWHDSLGNARGRAFYAQQIRSALARL